MTRVGGAKAAAVAGSTIVLLVGAFFFASYLVSNLFGLPRSVAFPLAVRAVGAVMVMVGLVVAGWLFRYRSPAAMVISTYITFMKLFKRVSMAEPSGRTEPLVLVGPQKYVRNPLYFGVIVMTFGWALVGGYVFVLIGAVLLLLWFRLVLIPFEERELRALFGEQYERYSNAVPMLVPFTKRKR